jgi:hypothetical protein
MGQLVGNPHLEDLRAGEEIIFTCNLEKQDDRALNVFIGLRMRTSGGLL